MEQNKNLLAKLSDNELSKLMISVVETYNLLGQELPLEDIVTSDQGELWWNLVRLAEYTRLEINKRETSKMNWGKESQK